MYVFGLHTCQHLLAKDSSQIIEVWLQQPVNAHLNPLILLLNQQGFRLQYCNKKTLDKFSEDSPHQGIVMRCKVQTHYDEQDLARLLSQKHQQRLVPLLLVLDGVKDPHNLGACLRTADGTGVDAVIIPKDRAVALTSTVHKVACGAAQFIPVIQVTNLARQLKWLKQQGVWLIGTSDAASQSLYQTELSGALAWVMGEEQKGLRRLTQTLCDQLVSIPMQGSVESLNVSVATAVCLYESLRQRLNKGC